MVHCTLHTAHCTLPLHTAHYKLKNAHCTLYTAHCTLPITLHTEHCTLHTANFTAHFTLSTVHYTMHTAQYTAHFALSTVHCTLHTGQYTLDINKYCRTRSTNILFYVQISIEGHWTNVWNLVCCNCFCCCCRFTLQWSPGSKRVTDLLNQSLTLVFVKQPLALSRSANYHWPDILAKRNTKLTLTGKRL